MRACLRFEVQTLPMLRRLPSNIAQLSARAGRKSQSQKPRRPRRPEDLNGGRRSRPGLWHPWRSARPHRGPRIIKSAAAVASQSDFVRGRGMTGRDVRSRIHSVPFQKAMGRSSFVGGAEPPVVEPRRWPTWKTMASSYPNAQHPTQGKRRPPSTDRRRTTLSLGPLD